MKDKDLKRWRIAREKGMLVYVLRNGILAWGVPMFIVMSFIVNKPFASGFTIKNVVIHGSIWLGAGIFFGVCTWWIIERMYKKEIENREHS
jgi:hypothetical protein